MVNCIINMAKEIELNNELDLHHFSPKDTKEIVLEFIKISKANNLKSIKIIHGKGKSVKKFQIYKLLESSNDVKSYYEDGSNWGSVIIVLKY